MKKRLLALLMAAAMMMATAACGSETTTAENNTTSTTEEGGSEEAASTEESTSTESNDTFTVAISYMPDSLSPQTGGSDDYTSVSPPPVHHPLPANLSGGLGSFLPPRTEAFAAGLSPPPLSRGGVGG
mgnify:CR=1 FL=1